MRADVEHLASLVRDSAGAGEREAAQFVAGRMRERGVQDVRVEPYRYQGTYAHAHALHAAAGLTRFRALAVAALVSLELEASGRRQWLRRLLPAGEGANVVGRLPARGERRRTLVLVAHHDAARTGRVWDPRIARLSSARNLRRRAIDGFEQPVALGLALAALGARRPARALLAVAVAGYLDVARSPTVPGASDNATGVAAVLELLGERPWPDHVEVLAVSTGSEESGMGGMAAFLRAHPLDPQATLVLGLDTLGAGTPIVARAEGTVLTHAYREQDLALVPPDVERWRIGGWTDPILARFAGIPALSLLSMGPEGFLPNYHVPSDTPEHVDWTSVERCVSAARATVAAFAR